MSDLIPPSAWILDALSEEETLAGVVAACSSCDGRAIDRSPYRDPSTGKATGCGERCPECEGRGLYFADDLLDGPAPALAAGSDKKIALLCQRYDGGFPLWQDGDAVDPHARAGESPPASHSLAFNRRQLVDRDAWGGGGL